MFTIDLMLKNSPLPLSVHRKTAEGAEALFQELTAAMRSGVSELLELTCEKMPEKKLAVFSDQLAAVQISQKTGASTSGKAPGFAASAEALGQ